MLIVVVRIKDRLVVVYPEFNIKPQDRCYSPEYAFRESSDAVFHAVTYLAALQVLLPGP